MTDRPADRAPMDGADQPGRVRLRLVAASPIPIGERVDAVGRGRPPQRTHCLIAITASVLLHLALILLLLMTPPPIVPHDARGDRLGDLAAGDAITVQIIRQSRAAPIPVDRIEPQAVGSAHLLARPQLIKSPQSLPVAPSSSAPAGAVRPPDQADSAREALSGGSLTQKTVVASEFQRRLFEHIRRFQRYPDAARPERLAGVVQIVFTMDRQGRVRGVWVKTSSGSGLLDQEAVATIERAAPLPPIPPDLPDPLSPTLVLEFEIPDR